MSTMDESTATTSKPNAEVDHKRQKTCPKTGLVGHHGVSQVWSYYNKHLIEGTNKYKGTCDCLFCHTIINAPSSSGTNELWNHLKKCREFPGFEGDKTQTILSVVRSQASTWRFDQDRCRKSLTKMIILDELAFSHVENEGFRQFCADLQPKFHVVCRTTITKDCIKMFHEERNKMKEYFKNLSTRVCITTDMWTSIQNLGYMVVTAHFVDGDWKVKKKIINFQVLPHPHKGATIAKALESCFLEWGLDKLMTITLDNAKNNDLCVVDLRRRLNKRNGLLLGGEFFHIRCFAHVINLVVKDGVEEVKSTIKRLRRSVKYVRSSPSHMQLFKKCVMEERIQSKRAVCLDVKTRWNSTFLMIDVALDFEIAFERLEEQDPNYRIECDTNDVGVLDTIDWERLKSLHIFLQKFYQLTKRVSGSNYITSNTYFEELTQVKDLLLEHLDSDDVYFREMAAKMNTKFDKYCNFESLNPILVISHVLDPRYKLQFVEFWYSSYLEKNSHLTENERSCKLEVFVEKLKDYMNRLYNHYKLEGTSFVDIDSSSTQVHEGSNLGKMNKRPTTKDLFRGIWKRKDYVEASNDLERYLSDGVVEIEERDFDVLAWWHGKVVTYRTLAMMARDVLSIPVTSVASESAFSTAGRVLDQFRSSLTPNIVECLICTQDWLRSPLPRISVEEKIEALEAIEEVVLGELGALSLVSSN